MKKITKEILKIAADRICIDMTEDQYDTLLEEFDVLLKQMDLINHIEGVDEAIPMTFPFVCVHDFLREDEPYNELTVEEGLKNASDVLDNQIKLPKVVN